MFYLNSNLNELASNLFKSYPDYVFKQTSTFSPDMNILDKENYTEIQICAPGFEKEEFSISYDKDILEIKAFKKEKEKIDSFLVREFSTDNFIKKIRIKDSVIDTWKIESTYKNGILYIKLPYASEKDREILKISIQ